MPRDSKSGLLVSKAYGPVECLGLDSAKLAECIAEMQRRPFLGVFGTPATGFLETTLEALRGQDQLKAVTFIDVDLLSIDALYELPQLQYLRLWRSRAPIEFRRLSALEHLVWRHSPRDSGLSTLVNLGDLRLWHYSHQDKSLGALELPASLARLDINWANLQSFNGLAPLPLLRRLEIQRCRDLHDLNHIVQVCPQLEHLEITACGRVSREHCQEVVANLPHLNVAVLQHKPLALASDT
jgi:hypothetical protein